MHHTFTKLAIVGAAYAVIVGFTLVIGGQPASDLTGQPTPIHHVGIVDDWSTHHVVFSDPGTYEEAKKTPASYAKWLNIRYDPRFIMQQMKRGRFAASGFRSATGGEEAVPPLGMGEPEDFPIGLLPGLHPEPIRPRPEPRARPLKQDWSANLLTGAVLPQSTPAKYTFNPVGTATCATDYVAYATGSEGTSTSATIIAYNNLYVGTGASACGATGPTRYWAYNTANTTTTPEPAVVTSPVLSGDGKQVAYIQATATTSNLVLLKWAQQSGSTVYGTLATSGTEVKLTQGTLTAANVGAPVYGVDIPAGDTIATVPSSTTATLTIAPTAAVTTAEPIYIGRALKGKLATSGTEVTLTTGTFSAADVGAQITGTDIPAGDTIVSVLSGTTANLVTAPTAAVTTAETLFVVPQTVNTPAVPVLETTFSAYRSCTAPCYFISSNLVYGGTNELDTFSSPFYDYAHDALYVGDDADDLYQFTGVFNGTSLTGPTAINLRGSVVVDENGTDYTVPLAYLVSPVFDSVSGCIFVGDTAGFVFSVNSGIAPGTVCTSKTFSLYGVSEGMGGSTTSNTDGTFDGPLVDSTAQRVYFFLNDANVLSAGCTVLHDSCVVQFTTTITGTAGTTTGANPNAAVEIGVGRDNCPIFAGTFDNVYFDSTTPGSPTGWIWVVGNQGVEASADCGGAGTLYRVAISANVMGAATAAVATLSGGAAFSSPVTEFCNPGAAGACAISGTPPTTTTGTDYIFFSVHEASVGGNCTNNTADGCVLAYNVSNPTAVSLAGTLNLANAPVCFATSGLVIDNASTVGTTGGSQVYFMNNNGNTTNLGGASPPLNGTLTYGNPATVTSGCTAGSGQTIAAVQAAQNGL